MDEGRRERYARNEAAFRKVNEAMGARSTPVEDGPTAYLCEWGALGCKQLVELKRDEDEAVRDHRRRFFVLPGHEIPEVEDVVETRDGYLVVEKHEEEAEIADSTDPRG